MTTAAATPEPVWRSDVGVELVRASASDADVVTAARVSTAGERAEEQRADDPAAHAGLIRFLLRNRHGTPFEHNSMTFLVTAPIFVFREFQRHRTGWSYNEESGRYRELAPVFYVPADDRDLVQVGKAGAYTFEPGTDEQRRVVAEQTRRACEGAHAAYRAMLGAGVAREVARGVLPVATFSSMYATCNARSLMAFLSLRTRHDEAAFPSYPQREIAMVAEQMEEHFARLMPLTHAAFLQARRVGP
ncbi:FAD-dependent thymidylate synthase [Vallicoccus soli]|uniref:Flavin-dependent thymidylate synthase n=1 Tax=Vallicoccus soli TaxID=2339232 RepID=A0A3A3ZKN0_9ACTN|nr:FAD-dependent thymidylate synthase [Vallicoccus soli]RJK96484.1 FAD-dependent thymidylate synthase [Vallicoccus soli]